ncbi:MAG: T9SS type A sorting domain-containing protein [Flavobacteriaceae bacterium]|nr:T9SS type A sorting domain-containing protein [Flavobacteriaceae bacterium]
MKTKLLFSVLFAIFFASNSMSAQCVRQASDFGNNTTPNYQVSGDVTVTLNTGGQTISLDTGTDFMTAAGPDVNAYLIKSNGMTNAQIAGTPLVSLENIHFGLISSNIVSPNGAKSFTVAIPSGTNIEEYDTIFFYCFQFNHFWDLGKFTPFTPANCTVLGIEDEVFEKQVTMYPNPVKDNLYVNTDFPEVINIKIYTILGEILLEEKITNTTIINTQKFKHGIYLVELTSGNKKITKQLIKN